MRLKLHKTRTVYRDVRNPRVWEKEWQPTWAGDTRVKHAFFFFFYSLEAVTYLEEQRSMRRRQLDFVSNTKYKEMCPFELREDTAVNQAAFTKGHVQLCHFEVWRCSISALDDVSEKGQNAKKKEKQNLCLIWGCYIQTSGWLTGSVFSLLTSSQTSPRLCNND